MEGFDSEWCLPPVMAPKVVLVAKVVKTFGTRESGPAIERTETLDEFRYQALLDEFRYQALLDEFRYRNS